MSLHRLTLSELQQEFSEAKVSAVEIAQAFSKRLALVEPKNKAFISPATKETLLAEAKSIDLKLRGWRRTSSLMAMPIAIMENVCTGGTKAPCGSRMSRTFLTH